MEGYPAIAQLMGCHDEFAIVRRFKELNMQDILYLQAEILHLKEELKKIELDDKEHPERVFFSRDWWSLANAQDEEGQKQWAIVLEIRRKLQEYNARITEQVFLSNQKGPNSYDLAFFRDWLERPKMGNFPLRGLDRNAWDTEYTDDLLAIKRREHADPVSRWFIDGFIPWFHNKFGSRFKKPIPESPLSEVSQYNETPLLRIVNILGTLVASLLPISSIVILYFVNNAVVRLGIVVAFTAVFSITLLLITQAKRAEVFAATSAFAAVQVVFISSNYVIVTT
ncbi:uncharacterized protein PAC_16978 [Phialocephala subalpina]|uniref:DUF6594 domain-containing protein n=1 Tax=Phialocephala subalpina TaxID=576137 RepID=A0A1L7XPX2_9HELO|nr:uncharacterized protein PAC_16978 [Phialocephala subalpina]